MQILILGSAAGGGFPQWNCHCENCSGLRNQTIRAQARTQSSIAVSSDGVRWVLVNASPDIRQQINQSPQLWPENQTRGSNLVAAILTDSQVDHTTGLLTLREGLPLDVYCTDVVHEDLTRTFPLFKILQHWHGGLTHHTIGTDHRQGFTIEQARGLTFYPVHLESNAPPYSPYRDDVVAGNNIGLKIVDNNSGKYLFYAPGIVDSSPLVESMLADAECVLIDGTLWLDDEMIKKGFGQKFGSQMGHMPVNGANGSVALLNRFAIKRKILIHINNTNPILNEDSSAHHFVINSGVEIATDGMEITI
ncbi:pyrroloquinoline quinone biosynthesis protein PqqB [Vibrio panuliri]|uniref:Coenzyme PQQ synthesis protein B n=1 Tax=Vibrio panuliri TaxID=1381081 RepID=A0A1Q9HAZ8_9VIBR|nr:pyrroloquinoline quinone biosynthesis protein PqqB [Vibrio panuliri]OLQ86317.1 pyrroloquinoline quinone biosynthesis protein PqqB [Vibrio panuliri]